MPIADLLGVRFDMQLLGKLSLSVATVLLISWGYRFYSSRGQGQGQTNGAIPGPRDTQASPATCSNCKMELRPRNKPAKEESDRENLNSVDDSLLPEREGAGTEERDHLQTVESDTAADTQEETLMVEENDIMEDLSMDVDKVEVKADEWKSGTALLPPPVTENGQASPSGRRSPCLLRLLEGGAGVGRELRQDLDHQGTFSSFLSKAEIKVEDADLVLEGSSGQSIGVRGKIYDYYVESSSHSVSDLSPTRSSLSPTLGKYEGGALLGLQPSELGGHNSSGMEPPRTPSPLPSPLIMRDLVFTLNSVEDPQSPVPPESRHPSRHGLIRKDSYLTAATNSEFHIPFPTPRASTTRGRSSSPSPEGSPSSPVSPSIPDTPDLKEEPSDEPSLETLAGAKFVHFPLEGSELESLKGKLDLGNCLEALDLAKKHGHAALQQASLRVMSDNYLQVLRDPALYGRLRAGERDQIQRQRMRGRHCLMVADMESPDWSRRPSQATEPESSKTASGLYYYDDYKDTWHLQCHIPQEVLSKGCAMCTMDNYLFVAVGLEGADRNATPSRKVFSYNPVTSIWNEICPMNEARPHCKLVALQGCVYAIGGECLSTVECYDPRTNRWTFVAPLPNDTFAVAHRATTCNGELFVSGGTLRYTLLRYNPKTDIWRPSLIVGSKERTTEMVAVRNFLYRFDVSPTLGISVYRYHAVARLWYECCSKRLPHCPSFQCVAVDDIIYCVSRQFTMRFLADEVSPSFVAEDLKVLSAAKGILFPFVLALPDKNTLQTRV